MRSVVLALSASAAIWAAPAQPADAPLMTGNALHEKCSAAEPDTSSAQDVQLCRTYIMAVYDGFMAERAKDQKPNCGPEGSTPDEVIDAILEHMRDQPAFHDSYASDLVRVSIIGAWPGCSEATG